MYKIYSALSYFLMLQPTMGDCCDFFFIPVGMTQARVSSLVVALAVRSSVAQQSSLSHSCQPHHTHRHIHGPNFGTQPLLHPGYRQESVGDYLQLEIRTGIASQVYL